MGRRRQAETLDRSDNFRLPIANETVYSANVFLNETIHAMQGLIWFRNHIAYELDQIVSIGDKVGIQVTSAVPKIYYPDPKDPTVYYPEPLLQIGYSLMATDTTALQAATDSISAAATFGKYKVLRESHTVTQNFTHSPTTAPTSMSNMDLAKEKARLAKQKANAMMNRAKEKSGLSGGAIAGIVIGAFVAAVGAGFAIRFFMHSGSRTHRKKHRRKRVSSSSSDDSSSSSNSSEYF